MPKRSPCSAVRSPLMRGFLARNIPGSWALSNLGWLLTARGDYAGAETLHRRALLSRRRCSAPGIWIQLPACLNNLAATLLAEGDYAGAESLYRPTLDIRRISSGQSTQVRRSHSGSLG